LAAYKKILVEKQLADDVIQERIAHRRRKNIRLYRNKRLFRPSEDTTVPIIWDADSKEAEFVLRPKRGAPEDAPIERMTVAQYFAEKQRLPLRFKHMPAIFLQDGKEKGHFPIEFLLQAFGKVKGVDNNVHVLQFNDEFASTDRLQHLQMIKREADMVMRDSSQHISTLLEQFHLTASNEPLTLTATVLKQPVIHFKANVSTTPRDGSWDLRGVKFAAPATMTSFAILDFANGDLKPFEFLFGVMQRHGIEMPRNLDLQKAISSLTVRVENTDPACVRIYGALFVYNTLELCYSCSNTHNPSSKSHRSSSSSW
jgi:hypothetical protein